MALSSRSVTNDPSAQFVEKRRSQRLIPNRGADFILQKDWGHIAQIALDDNNVIIGEIKDISTGGIACKVAYQFDIIDPIDIKLVLFLRNSHSGIYSFSRISIRSTIVRSQQIDTDFCEIGIQFVEMNKCIVLGVDQIIQSLTK